MDTSHNYLDRKMGLLFRFIDRNKYGNVSVDDFFMVPTRLEHAGKRDQAATLRTAYQLVWDKLLETKHDLQAKHITEEEFVFGMRNVRKMDWFVDGFVYPMTNAYFDTVDTNHDNTISIKEWRTYLSFRGMEDEKFIKRTFDKLDSNKDGIVSREEFQYAVVQFSTSDDPREDYSFLYDLKVTNH